MFVLEKPGVDPKGPGADPAPNGVVDRVAQDGRHDQQRQHHGDIQRIGIERCHRAGGKQQRVAREERHHHQTGLAEDNGKQQHVGPRPPGIDKAVEVVVEMQKDIENAADGVHRFRRPCVQDGMACRSLRQATAQEAAASRYAIGDRFATGLRGPPAGRQTGRIPRRYRCQTAPAMIQMPRQNRLTTNQAAIDSNMLRHPRWETPANHRSGKGRRRKNLAACSPAPTPPRRRWGCYHSRDALRWSGGNRTASLFSATSRLFVQSTAVRSRAFRGLQNAPLESGRPGAPILGRHGRR